MNQLLIKMKYIGLRPKSSIDKGIIKNNYIDISAFDSGVYFIEIINNETYKHASIKVIKD